MSYSDEKNGTNNIGQIRHDIDVAGAHLQNAANIAESQELPAYITLQIQHMIVQIHGLEHILRRMKSNI